MRELKLRAWIERYQKYMPVSLINFEPISGKIVSIEVVATGGDWCKFYPEEYVLEQDTGFKDKNDKEICEGDIVSIYKGSKNFAVEQNRGRWEIGLDSLYLWQDFCEIIGNIHENGDLLGDINVTNKDEE